MLITAVLAVPPAHSAPGVLQLYNWADYVPEVLIKGFEEEFGVDVVYNTYSSEALMGTRLMTGNTGYDLIGMSNYRFAYHYPVAVYQPLDHDRLPNRRNLDPWIMDQLAAADPGNRFFTPYFWGTAGVAYDIDAIQARLPDAPLDSLALLFDPAVVRHFADCGVAFYDDMFQALTLAGLYAGYGVNDKSAEALAAAEAVIREIRPYIRYFEDGRLGIDLPTGEVCLSMAWNGDFSVGKQRAVDDGLDINLHYTLGKEGSNLWIDGWVIPVNAPNPELAHQFLDYLMRPEVMAAVTNQERYANAILPSRPLIDPEILNDPVIFHTEEMLQRVELQTPHTQQERRPLGRAWGRIKADFE